MATEHYFQEAGAWNDSDEDEISSEKLDEISSEKLESTDDTVVESAGGFNCNICLEIVQDPVVTLCGHLYCWPCIYQWMNVWSVSPENPDQRPPLCPICKAEISERTIIPLYGPGRNAKSSEGNGTLPSMIVPERPSLACGRIHTPVMSATAHSSDTAQQFRRRRSHPQQPRSYHAQPTPEPRSYHAQHTPEVAGVTTDSLNPMAGTFGEMVYARIFGNSDGGLSGYTNLYASPNSYQLAGSNNPRVRRYIMQADQSLGRISFFLFCCAVVCLLLF